MKKYLFLLLSLALVTDLYSQERFEISEICVGYVKKSQNDSIYRENDDNGPSIYIKCTLFNDGNNDIILFPKKSKLNMLFNYKGIDRIRETIDMGFQEKDSIILKPSNSIEMNLFRYIIPGMVPIFDGDINDYSLIILEFLPTLRIQYIDPKFKIISTKINKVEIK